MAEPAEAPDVQKNDVSTPGGVTGKGFRPGASGNPGGRPKGLASKVREVLGNDDGETLARFWAAVLSGAVSSVRIVPDPTGPRGATKTETYTEIVEVKDRVAVSKFLAERGWGKAPQFAPIEDADPLDRSDAEAAEIADSFDSALDELAAKRQAKTDPPEPAP